MHANRHTMVSKRDQILLAVGTALVLGVTFLPVPENAVRVIAEESLIRTQVSNVFNKAGLGHETPVNLVYQLDGDSGVVSQPNAINTMIGTLQHTDDQKVTLPAFVFDTKARHTLCVSLQEARGYVTAVTTLATQNEFSTECAPIAGSKPSVSHWSSDGRQRIGDGLSLVPPLIALIIAIALRKVIWALFLAVFAGGVIMKGNVLTNLWLELKTVCVAIPSMIGADVKLDGYIGTVIADSFNLQILGFTLALVGMVAVISRMGGTSGLVNSMSRFARGPRSAQAVTSAMGTAIFFDDYANTVVVGTTARTLTDRHRISREKLAYIVDSTSAPVAGIAIVSTWIGYEVGLFDSLLGTLSAVNDVPSSGYELFFAILPLRFYCIFALVLVFLNAWTARDFGPMYHAEIRTRQGGPVVPEGSGTEHSGLGQLARDDIPHRAINAILPIAAVLLTILGSILWIGSKSGPLELNSLMGWKTLFDSAADHIQTILFGAALMGSLIAITLALTQRLLGLKESLNAYVSGVKTLWEAVAILILAWAIKSVCSDVGTGHALIALVGDAIPSMVLPLVIFLLSGTIAFSVGSSWATMALVLPIAAPLSADLSGGDYLIVMASLGAVLDGAIWGDHCSPISDTTILSSTATGCPHLAHVKTQIPYATLAMISAAAVGYLGVTAGLPVALAYILGPMLMWAGLILIGRPVPSRIPGESV